MLSHVTMRAEGGTVATDQKYIFHTFPRAENVTRHWKHLPCKCQYLGDSVISELQAGFLITNAVRFIFQAPGIASWQYTLLQLQVKESSELHYTSSPEHCWDGFPLSGLNSSYDSILCFLGLEACWIQEHSVEEDIRTSLTDLPLNVLLSHLPCMCLSISLYMVSFAFKLISVYTKFSRKTKLVWLIHGLLHETPLRCALFALLPVPFLPALAFYPSPLTVVEKMSCERFWLLVSVLVGDHRLFFSGEWCLTHPSITLSCPVDSCYSLWRSQSVGPDEQGLLHLTGRFLSTWNHYRDKSRRWKGFVKWKFSRFVHIIVKHCWIFGCPSCCPLSVEVNIASWTDALIFSASLQISQGDRKLWWFHNSLQGICFLSDKYSLTKGSTWR